MMHSDVLRTTGGHTRGRPGGHTGGPRVLVSGSGLHHVRPLVQPYPTRQRKRRDDAGNLAWCCELWWYA